MDTQVDIFEYLEPSALKPLNNILTVSFSTPIELGEYKREVRMFESAELKEEHLSTLDIFSRRESRTGNLEIVVLNVDLWK